MSSDRSVVVQRSTLSPQPWSTGRQKLLDEGFTAHPASAVSARWIPWTSSTTQITDNAASWSPEALHDLLVSPVHHRVQAAEGAQAGRDPTPSATDHTDVVVAEQRPVPIWLGALFGHGIPGNVRLAFSVDGR